MSNAVIVVGDKEVTVPVPDVFSALAAALPVVVRLFNSDKSAVSDALSIYSMVGGAYTYPKWLARVKDDCRLVEGRDYFTVDLDPSIEENRAAIAKGRGQVTYMTLKSCRKVVMWAGKDESHLMFDYYDAVADAATPYLLKQLSATQEHLEGEKRHNKAQREHNNLLAEKLGHHGVPQAVNMALELKAAHQALADLRVSKGDGGYALEAYERAIEAGALRLKKVKNNPSKIEDAADEFMKTLEEVRGGNATYRSCF